MANRSRYSAALKVAALATILPMLCLKPALGQRPSEAKILNDRSIELYAAGKYTEAIAVSERELALRLKQRPPSPPHIATVLTNLAEIHLKLNHYVEAESLSRRALAIREKALGSEHVDVAKSLNRLGLLYRALSRYGEAEQFFKRALAIQERTKDSETQEFAQTLDDLGGLYHTQGRYGEAEVLFKRALALLEKALGPDDREVGRSLADLGRLYVDQGRYPEAEQLLKRAVRIAEKISGVDSSAAAHAVSELASFYSNQARYDEAEPLLRRALSIYENSAGADSHYAAVLVASLGISYHRQGRYGDAELLYKRALDVLARLLGADDPQLGTLLNNYARLYQDQRRYAEAEPLYKRSLAIKEKVFGLEHPAVAISQGNLASLYSHEGRYGEAEPLLRRALATQQKVLGPDHSELGSTVGELALLLYRDPHRAAEAEPLFKRALTIKEKAFGIDHPNVAPAMNALAELYALQGRTADALPLIQRVVGNGRAWPQIAFPILLEAQRTGLLSAEEAVDNSLDVIQRLAQTAAAAAVSKLAVRLAAGSDRLAQLVRKDQDLFSESEALDKTIVAAVSQEPAKRNAVLEQRTRERLASIAREREAVQKTLATEFPDYAALSNPRPLTMKDIRPLLSDQEAVVIFAPVVANLTYVFVITREVFVWKPIPLGGEAMAQKVATFRKGLDVDELVQSLARSQDPQLFDLTLANELYSTLISPVEDIVKQKRDLLIVPAGSLTALPFHLLVTEKMSGPAPDIAHLELYRDAAWLIKQHTVTVLPSLTSLKALRAVSRNQDQKLPMIGFADPIFDPNEAVSGAQHASKTGRKLATRSFADFWKGAAVDRDKLSGALPRLEDTADELHTVAQKLHASAGDIYLRGRASERNVKQAKLSDYRVVYFATHGLVAGDVKGVAEPSLALSIPKQPDDVDDGLLTASEVAQLKLNADWVVLSACNTIAGDKPGAEALSGLARAFFYAGARALLVSHWAVESNAATRLTTSTFDAIASEPKIGRAEALRRAMLAYMNDTSATRYAYPAFWGPFALIGEGGKQ